MARSDPGYRPLLLTGSDNLRSTKAAFGADTGLGLSDWLTGGALTAAGLAITPDNARECAEVDACVGLIEDTIATVPLELFHRIDSDRSELADADPLYGLLHDEPNGWQTSAEFRQMLEGFHQTHGRAYARVVSNNRGPVALEPEHPDRMRAFRASDGEVAYYWTPIDAPARTLLASEVLHLRDGKPLRSNLVEGESKVVRAREDIALLMACSQYLARFFSNNATPKLAFKIPGELSDASSDALRERLMRRHAGLENAHRPAILDGGADLVAIGQTNDDAQVIEVHGLALSKVTRRWGVPPHLIGETDKTTSWGTGIEQQSIGFVTYYMRPKFVVWEQALNRTLMSRDKRAKFYFQFDLDAMLRGDFSSRMQGYALMIQWGLATPNEIRKLMGFPPAAGGDERLQPLNMAPATRIMDVLLRDPAAAKTTQRDAADQVTRLLAQFIAENANAVRLPLAA